MMGYLSTDSADIPDFTKAVISLWFRVPQKSIDAFFAAKKNTPGTIYPSFRVGLPIVAFGPAANPSFIGIDCFSNSNAAGTAPYLMFAFLFSGTASISGITLNNNGPEFFNVDTGFAANHGVLANGPPTPPQVTTDAWHHVLLSVDFSSPCVTAGGTGRYTSTAADTTSNGRLWYAIDDVNYNGPDNLAPWSVDGSADPQAILTYNGYQVANSSTGTYSFNTTVPANGLPFGIPAPSGSASDVYQIELAEFMMWTGVTLDTGVTENRRAFITDKGEPVNAVISSSDDLLGIAAKAIKLLGKPPDVLLHGSTRWIGGLNSGSANLGLKGTGTIKPFTPSPKLGA